MTRDTWKDMLIVSGLFVFLGTGVVGLILEKRRQGRIATIVAGEIHGNKVTHVFHVPTCPQYNSIEPGNLETFDTVDAAKKANYRAARNCDDAINIRTINETGDYEAPETDRDDPRY